MNSGIQRSFSLQMAKSWGNISRFIFYPLVNICPIEKPSPGPGLTCQRLLLPCRERSSLFSNVPLSVSARRSAGRPSFPDLPREFVKSGAQFLVNITNEAWFGRSVGPQHYVISSVFRAVENRVYVVRCANTGISCFIDPYGRITGRVQKDGKDTLVEGYLTRPVYLSEERTFYTKHGDLFAYLCLLVSVVVIGASLWRVKR